MLIHSQTSWPYLISEFLVAGSSWPRTFFTPQVFLFSIQPTRVPLTSMPIGKPWQMVAVDILTVPVSTNGNKCILVVQDYFTKWADAIPLPNQSASMITSALLKLFSQMGMPDIIHSDQGHNFESALLKQSLEAFGIS